MNLFDLWKCYRIARRCSGYEPQPVTISNIKHWLNQYDLGDRAALLRLVDSIIYFSEREVKRKLVEKNRALLERLRQDGIPAKNVIYIQVHEAGSSSMAMLHKLRNAALLENQGCHFLDSRDGIGIVKITNKLAEGAIIYVDDFAGTGKQFTDVQKVVNESIIGNFPQFLLLPVICEEALYKLGRCGVEAINAFVHSKAERPLHPMSNILPEQMKRRLTELSYNIHPKAGLGYEHLAAMVVFYHNAPNSLPLVLRGNKGQSPMMGIFPRTTDLDAEISQT